MATPAAISVVKRFWKWLWFYARVRQAMRDVLPRLNGIRLAQIVGLSAKGRRMRWRILRTCLRIKRLYQRQPAFKARNRQDQVKAWCFSELPFEDYPGGGGYLQITRELMAIRDS